MSDRLAKRQPIDLEELDRQLRDPHAANPPEQEDPLAELARLVNSSPDPFAPMFSKGGAAAQRSNAAGFSQAQPQFRPGFDRRSSDNPGEPWQAADDQNADIESEFDSFGMAREPRPKRSKVVVLGALGLVAGLAVVSTALFTRAHVGRAGAPPTILADVSPYKIPGPGQNKQAGAAAPGSADSVQSARLVTTEEQPVDLALAASNKDQTGSRAGASFFPPPRRVKTVLVRPDGTIIDSDGANASDAPATKDGETSTASPPQAPSTNSVDSRGAPPPVGPGAGAGSVVQSPTSPSAPSATPDPVAAASSTAPVANADNSEDTGGAVTEDSPDQPTTGSQSPPPSQASPAARTAARPVQTAEAETPAVAASTGPNTWAVQLAAPGSQRDAAASSTKLSRKFAKELGGRSLVSRQAESNGREVWRVRVAGMSHQDAIDVCTRIKSVGGACFLAHE